VVAYPEERPKQAMVCGPAGDNPTVVDLDPGRAERLYFTDDDHVSK